MAQLSSQQVEKMLCAGRAAASEAGLSVCIAIACAAGNLSGFLRVGDAFLISTDLAIDKAWTSAGMKMSSRELGDALRTMPDNVRDGLLRRPRLTEVPGGFPVLADSQCLGGVGVSGGSDEQDEAIARAMLAALEG
jgi:glc operon protein GlcG